MEASSVAKVVDDILQRHDQEILRRLDTWLSEVDRLMERRIIGPELSKSIPLEPGTASSVLEAPDMPCLGSQALDAAFPASIEKKPNGSGPLISSRQISRRFSIKSYEDAIEAGGRIEQLKKSQSVMMEAALAAASSETRPECCQDLRDKTKRFVSSPGFDLFFLALILMNSIYLGVQLEWMAAVGDQRYEELWMAINTGFAVIFTFEILIRLFAAGPKGYIWGRGCGWNWLDLIVVTSAWLEVIAQHLSVNADESSSSSMRIMRVFRIGKLLQSVRSFRVLKFLTALRILVYSIVDATRSLFWALLLLMIMLYIFGLLFADAILHYLSTQDGTDCCESLELYFGSVSKAMTTLFRSILGGIDWNSPADALAEVDEGWKQLFHLYIGLAMLALLNVMIGVFCNSTIRAAELNHEVMMENRAQFRTKAAKLFHRMDETGFGSLTITEFERAFDQENMKAFLESIDVNATDAWTLFDSLNLDGDSVLTLEEFTEGCLLLKGPARSVDLYALKQQGRKLRKQIQQGILLMQQEIRGLAKQLADSKGDAHNAMPSIESGFQSWAF